MPGKCYRCGNEIEGRVRFWGRRACRNCVEIGATRQEAEARAELRKEFRTIGHELLGPYHDLGKRR
jgi:hypothetical protein